MAFLKRLLLISILHVSLDFLNAVLADKDRSQQVQVDGRYSSILRRAVSLPLLGAGKKKLCQEGEGSAIVVQTPPEFVYRTDFRPPSLVFKKGMESLGKNDDLLEHMKGVSTHYGPKKNSLFVSTSAVETNCMEWAKVQMKNRSNRNKRSIYVYKIRANGNYYSMDKSLMNAFAVSGNAEFKTQAEKVAKFYSEWEACGGVKPEEVVSATEYQRDPAQPAMLKQVQTEVNPKFSQQPTRGNQHSFVPKALRMKVA